MMEIQYKQFQSEEPPNNVKILLYNKNNQEFDIGVRREDDSWKINGMIWKHPIHYTHWCVLPFPSK